MTDTAARDRHSASAAPRRELTVRTIAMNFIKAMRVGEVLEVYTEVESVGRASMTIHVEASARRFQTRHRDTVTDAGPLSTSCACSIHDIRVSFVPPTRLPALQDEPARRLF